VDQRSSARGELQRAKDLRPISLKSEKMKTAGMIDG